MKNYIVIDLKDYTDEKEKYTFDWNDFWFDTPRFKSLKEIETHHGIPQVKFPASFTEEDKLDCINEAYCRADEDSYMCDYINTFHKNFLSALNEDKKLSFEYEENYWDSIKLRVFYPIEFVVGDVEEDGDTYSSVEEYIASKIEFGEIIKRVKESMDRGYYHDGEAFDATYLDIIKDKIYEIKGEKLTTYQKVKNMMDRHISKRKKVYNIIKIVKEGR